MPKAKRGGVPVTTRAVIARINRALKPDDQMLKIMARENLEEWGTSAAVEHETVRAVIEAYADERIELGQVSRDAQKSSIRYAPSFIQGDDSTVPSNRPYTAGLVADFLGWNINKVTYALGALELIGEGALTESDFDGLRTEAAKRIVEEARKAKREHRVVRSRQEARVVG